jgi:hypothetical protein
LNKGNAVVIGNDLIEFMKVLAVRPTELAENLRVVGCKNSLKILIKSNLQGIIFEFF